jgi:hypothetical protein
MNIQSKEDRMVAAHKAGCEEYAVHPLMKATDVETMSHARFPNSEEAYAFYSAYVGARLRATYPR